MLTRLETDADAARWLQRRVRGTLSSDSRRLNAGDAFVAWPGMAHDARRFVPDALRTGAAACLVECDRIEAFGFDDARIAAVPQLKRRCGPIAAEFFGHPSRRLAMVATTGTNGKTSTAWWVAQALGALGRRSIAVGTLGAGEPPAGVASADAAAAFAPTGLTTPDAVMLQRLLHEAAGRGIAACAIEASSIGLAEHRLAGTHFDVALFTNLTQDHLDYHGGMGAYWAAKRALFDWPGLKAAVIDIDDAHGAALAEELRGSGLDLWTCSRRGEARLTARQLRTFDGGLGFALCEGAQVLPLQVRVLGEFNAANLLLVAGALRALGFTLTDAAAALAVVTPPPGRMQRVPAPAASLPEVVVDYAHTPDALDKALAALRPFACARSGRLWCVFGCGGNRDAGKRPAMGEVAARQADRVVLTSDNPRHEPPRAILDQILAGITLQTAVEVVEDRREAIAHAVHAAAAEDVILLAGKGHEDYQETAGVRRPFSDAAEAGAALRARAGTAP